MGILRESEDCPASGHTYFREDRHISPEEYDTTICGVGTMLGVSGYTFILLFELMLS